MVGNEVSISRSRMLAVSASALVVMVAGCIEDPMLSAAGGASGAHGVRQQAVGETVAEEESDVVFDTSVVQEIRSEVAPEHIDDLEEDHTRRGPCKLSFGGDTLHEAGSRQRGQGTQLRS